jgi:hypothetical protein
MGFLKLGGLLATLMLMAAVGLLWKANERKAAELGVLQASLAGAEATIIFKDRLAIHSQVLADALADQDATNRTAMEAITHERDRLRVTAERRALEDPYDFGDGFEFELARLFCLFEAGSDRRARKACDLHSRQAYSPDIALTLTATPELAERWREACEVGAIESDDFCRWSVTGFTAQGGITVLNYLERLASYTLALEDRAGALEAMLRELAERPKPEQESP